MKKYDIVICGGGVAGLWLLNTLSDKGFSVLLVESVAIGGVQTMASQGMIHGGQRYLLHGKSFVHAKRIASLPERWEACLLGHGDIDLHEVRVLAEHQVMWPAGGLLARASLLGAAHRIKTKIRKLSRAEYPEVFTSGSAFAGPVYELPEKVLDMISLVSVLSKRYGDRMRKGEVRSLDREGHIDISGTSVEAQLIISVAGLGNETVLDLLGVDKGHSQRRPLRQIMVRALPYPLYGHGVVPSPSPRVTITSYPDPSGGYVWYLGGAIAISSVSLTEEETIEFAKKEMQTLFKDIDWSAKEWATWYGERAEARDPNGRLPEGPVIQEYGKTLVAWPTKLTFAPLLSDHVLTLIGERNIKPKYTGALPEFPTPPFAITPWERAAWTS